MKSLSLAFLILVQVCVLEQCGAAAVARVDPSSITVSGFSSGGAMSMQLHLAHSSLLSGVGFFGALPYGCGHFANSTHCHLTSDAEYLDFIRTHAWLGNLDPVSNVQQDNVFVFHGALDTGIIPPLGDKIVNIYEKLGARVVRKSDLPAAHGFPTVSYGGQCDRDSVTTGYLSNCSYNGAFEALNSLYGGNLNPPSSSWEGSLSLFDQTPFIPPGYDSPIEISLDSSGFVYVPSKCVPGVECRLHVALHGCQQSRSIIGDVFVRNAGYLQVADANDIIIVFPQAASSQLTPAGCWNWWGYYQGSGSSEFLTKRAPQIQTLYNIINSSL